MFFRDIYHLMGLPHKATLLATFLTIGGVLIVCALACLIARWRR